MALRDSPRVRLTACSASPTQSATLDRESPLTGIHPKIHGEGAGGVALGVWFMCLKYRTPSVYTSIFVYIYIHIYMAVGQYLIIPLPQLFTTMTKVVIVVQVMTHTRRSTVFRAVHQGIPTPRMVSHLTPTLAQKSLESSIFLQYPGVLHHHYNHGSYFLANSTLS